LYFLTIVLLFVGNSVLDPLLRSVFGSYRSYSDISGSFVGGKYTSPTGDFTCEFPNRNIAGDTLKDTFDQNSGRVVFFDDFGTLLSVDYIDNGQLSVFGDPDEEKSYLEEALASLMQSMFVPASPTSSISYKEFLNNKNQVILYAVINFPKGSTLADSKTGERLDALRGVFIFNKGKYLYMLNSQSGVFDPNDSSSIENLKKDLEEFYNTCEFK
jgi:hypothetical protein